MTINNGRAGVIVNYHDVDLIVIDAKRSAVKMDCGKEFRFVELLIHDGEFVRTVYIIGRKSDDGGEPISLVVKDKYHESRYEL